MVRIGIISPYSLTIPGGVQQQVMGLARELRAMGHETRVLGPCDGPPPASFVSPLGNSLPTAANGSIAPIAPDPSAQFRLIRLLRDEEFDVLHVHEPLAPGVTETALFLRDKERMSTVAIGLVGQIDRDDVDVGGSRTSDLWGSCRGFIHGGL